MKSYINYLKKISLIRPRKSKIIVVDKNYNEQLEKLINKDFIVFNRNLPRLNVFLIITAVFEYIRFNERLFSFNYIYLKKYIEKVDPDIVISFEDTDFEFLRLSKIFKTKRFILIQNSYRPKGFYGKLTLKKKDILITYSPIVKFNICLNETPMKSFKYSSGNDIKKLLENKVIFISQYRQYTNDEFVRVTKEYYSEIDDGLLFNDEPDFFGDQDEFLNYLSKYFKKVEKNFFIKALLENRLLSINMMK